MAEQKGETTDTVKIKAVPKTKPNANEHFEIVKDIKLDELKEDQLLLQIEYISGFVIFLSLHSNDFSNFNHL